MSLRNTFTSKETAGLVRHRLPTIKASQLSDAFVLGMRYQETRMINQHISEVKTLLSEILNSNFKTNEFTSEITNLLEKLNGSK